MPSLTTEILKHFGVVCSDDRKWLSKAETSVKCPFCDDPGFHCGVFAKGNFSCWRCGSVGSLYKLIKQATGIKYQDFVSTCRTLIPPDLSGSILNQVLAQFQGAEVAKSEQRGTVKFPAEAVPIAQCLNNYFVQTYLQRRRYTPKDLIDAECLFCEVGDYWSRIIIPFFDKEHNVIGYQGADTTGTARIKYKNDPNFPIHETFYGLWNVNTINNRVYLVEGVLDRWRFGYDSLATCGTQLTSGQILLLANLPVSEVVLAWDDDAYLKGLGVLNALSDSGKRVGIVRLVGGDPDDLGRAATLAFPIQWIG